MWLRPVDGQLFQVIKNTEVWAFSAVSAEEGVSVGKWPSKGQTTPTPTVVYNPQSVQERRYQDDTNMKRLLLLGLVFAAFHISHSQIPGEVSIV